MSTLSRLWLMGALLIAPALCANPLHNTLSLKAPQGDQIITLLYDLLDIGYESNQYHYLTSKVLHEYILEAAKKYPPVIQSLVQQFVQKDNKRKKMEFILELAATPPTAKKLRRELLDIINKLEVHLLDPKQLEQKPTSCGLHPIFVGDPTKGSLDITIYSSDRPAKVLSPDGKKYDIETVYDEVGNKRPDWPPQARDKNGHIKPGWRIIQD